MQNNTYHIIIPIKDSLQIAERALRALKGQPVTIWNDNSTAENTQLLHSLAEELGFECIDVATLTNHPSPNYLLLLRLMRQRAISNNHHLIIVESDVIVTNSSIARMVDIAQQQNIGMVAAVTHNDNGKVNFPYEYAQKYSIGAIETRKRLSFCCTLMTVEMLQRVDFDQLNPEKDWFDVTITRLSREQGLTNILLTDSPVRHYPHSSRPWKQLKYTNPLRYYWRKIFYAKDKI
jgi:hypothetical protein